MKLLQDRILAEGKALGEDVLKVDSFINHQVDPALMAEIGKEFARHFAGRNITKVVTIESSGIAPAVAAAYKMGVPAVILKKQTSKILSGDVYQTSVTSYTKGTSYELTLSKNYIGPEDQVLIIDDFLANGEAAKGALRLMDMAGARVTGIGILIEKSFQAGRSSLEGMGLEVYSLARVKKLGVNQIEFIED